MNYLYSPALVAVYSVRYCSDGVPSDLLKAMSIGKWSSPRASVTKYYQTPQSSAISNHSYVTGTPQAIREWLMLLPQDSHASRLLLEESIEDETMIETSGLRPLALFESSDRRGYCLRTVQDSLPGMEIENRTSEQLLETFTKAGMWDDGGCYQQPHWDTLTGVIVYGLLPTPVKSDGHGFYAIGYEGSLRRWKLKKGRENRQMHWSQFAAISKRMRRARANPRFSEALMGYPLGWTDLKPLEMDKFQQWLRRFLK